MTETTKNQESVKESPPPKIPGPLQTSISLTLHTRSAAKRFHGRRGSIMGLKGFSYSCDRLGETAAGRAAHSRVEERLKTHQTRLEQLARQNQEAKAACPFEVVRHKSTAPVTETLNYCPPLVGRAAQMLALFDEIILDLNLLHRLGMYDTKERYTRQELATRYISRAFHCGWVVLGEINASRSPNQPAPDHPEPETSQESNDTTPPPTSPHP